MVVRSSKSAVGVRHGYDRRDHVNVLSTRCGMEMHVYRILVPLVRDGISNLNHANV